MDRTTLQASIAALGNELSLPMIQSTNALFAPLVARPDESHVLRDVAYGDHERHRLDLFLPEGEGDHRPIVVFVHGGGFVMGGKGEPGMPYYGNIGAWAAANDMIGVTLNYRLAPGHAWPAGAEDVALAVAWLTENAVAHGGDPGCIVLVGQSAGATHVAGVVADPLLAAGRIAGAAMLSGWYDVSISDGGERIEAYFGTDPALYQQRSPLAGLAATKIPCLFTVSEFDPADFQRQAGAVVAARLAVKGQWPAMHWLKGDNHISPVAQIGSDFDNIGPLLASFVAKFSHAATREDGEDK